MMETASKRDELDDVAERCSVSRGRALIWEKEGKQVCMDCDGPVLRANYPRPIHVDFRITGHHARLAGSS